MSSDGGGRVGLSRGWVGGSAARTASVINCYGYEIVRLSMSRAHNLRVRVKVDVAGEGRLSL